MQYSEKALGLEAVTDQNPWKYLLRSSFSKMSKSLYFLNTRMYINFIDDVLNTVSGTYKQDLDGLRYNVGILWTHLDVMTSQD